MTVLSQREAVQLKLHLLSEGVSFDTVFLEHFADELDSMEKRRAYDDSDERELDRTKRIPQEMYLSDGVVVAVNYKQHSPWQLVYRDSTYRLRRSPSRLPGRCEHDQPTHCGEDGDEPDRRPASDSHTFARVTSKSPAGSHCPRLSDPIRGMSQRVTRKSSIRSRTSG